MTSFIEFTIRNLGLRIERATEQLKMNKHKLEFAEQDKDMFKVSSINDRVGRLNDSIAGYKEAKLKLQNNHPILISNAKYIIKSLEVRQRFLNENLSTCKNAIETETVALKTKKYAVMNAGDGLSITMEQYDDVSIRIIKQCEERVNNITKSLKHCDDALEFFKGYLI